MTEKFYTAAEVAAMLGANQRTVRRWINTGELEAFNIGGAIGYRITPRALEAFLERRKVTAAVRKPIDKQEQ